MFSEIFSAVTMTFSFETLLMLSIGVLFGAIVGALPGLGTAVAITVCIPFTLSMDNVPAIALLLGVYASSVYGGSISAVLLNTPGTPQSAATGMDGYPMAAAGKGSQALGWVTSASIIGGLISCIFLIVAAPQLAKISVKYGGPLEICGLICMGLACISSLSEGNQLKGMLMGITGLFIATVGSDPISGEIRFTFGSDNLVAGIALMPVVVGVFPLAEVFYRVYELSAKRDVSAIKCTKIKFPKLKEWKGRVWGLIRSSLIGVGLGTLPGTGATASTFIAYTFARRSSKRGARFGKGEPDGLIAAESSNNAVTGGALIPTLALGIPGEPVAALMLATLTLHDITPGVRLMADHPEVVYSAFLNLILANLLLIPVAIFTVRCFGYVIKLSAPVLLGLIVVCSVIGVYLPRGNMFDVPMALIIGIATFAFRIGKFPITPLIIGYVLGPQLEYRLGQAAVYKGDMSLIEYIGTSPIAIVLFSAALLFLAIPLVKSTIDVFKKEADYPDQPIKIIVPFNKGETDISARLIAPELEKVVGQSVVVQNIAGKSGMIGCQAMLSANPDGYTLGVVPSGPLALYPHMSEPPYTIDSFAYVGRIINSPYLVYVAKDTPWNTFNDMIEDMKANPNKYDWASSGVGSVPFFAYEELSAAFGVQARHVPFTDDMDAFQAIASNRAHVYTTTAGALTKYDVKALALLDKKRSPLLPELPSISEFGKDVFYSQWMVLVAAKKVPQSILDTLSEAMARAMKSPDFIESLQRVGLAPDYLGSAETKAFVKAESERSGKNIKKEQDSY